MKIKNEEAGATVAGNPDGFVRAAFLRVADPRSGLGSLVAPGKVKITKQSQIENAKTT